LLPQDAHQLALALEGCDLSCPQALRQALQQYQQVRLPRTTAVQSIASEGCGLPSIYGPLRPKECVDALHLGWARFSAMTAWLNHYPK
jgi:2-polyprenyl-6-methoxyphenol hydroxylase-like FAD-dependent oxidoreductase